MKKSNNSEIERKIDYHKADSVFSKQNLSEFFSRNFIPTKRMNYFLIGILVIVLLIGLARFPLNSFLSGDIDNLKIQVGYPLDFMVIYLSEPQGQPFHFGALIVDLIIYLVIAYIFDIFISLVGRYFSSKMGHAKYSNSGLIRKGVSVVEVE